MLRQMLPRKGMDYSFIREHKVPVSISVGLFVGALSLLMGSGVGWSFVVVVVAAGASYAFLKAN